MLALIAAIGSGLIAGVFYAFSTFVMGALGRLPAPVGIAAMQQINIVVINPLFLGAFMGTAGVCVAAGIVAGMTWSQPGSALVAAGAALYVVGTFGVTMACNVPLNNALAKVVPDAPAAAKAWADYVSRWTMWNHVRMAAALAAAVLFTLSLRK